MRAFSCSPLLNFLPRYSFWKAPERLVGPSPCTWSSFMRAKRVLEAQKRTLQRARKGIVWGIEGLYCGGWRVHLRLSSRHRGNPKKIHSQSSLYFAAHNVGRFAICDLISSRCWRLLIDGQAVLTMTMDIGFHSWTNFEWRINQLFFNYLQRTSSLMSWPVLHQINDVTKSTIFENVFLYNE